MIRNERGDRAQLVLAASVVIAVALAAVVLAYLQLSVHPDAGVEDADYDGDARRFLERATHEAGAEVTGIDWVERAQAVERVQAELAPRLDTLNASRVEEGVAYAVRYDRSAASAWTDEHCPRGEGRRFGPCRAIEGVVVQERAGEASVLAVAYDVRVTTPRNERALSDRGLTTATGNVAGRPVPPRVSKPAETGIPRLSL